MNFDEQIAIEANNYVHIEQREAYIKGAMRGYSLAMYQFNKILYEKEKLKTTQEIAVKSEEELLKSL